MSTTTERKTLSMKGKPGMWQAPSPVDMIEENLRKSAKQILEEFISNYPAPTYDENYRLNHITVQKLSARLAEALTELRETVKFPSQAPKILENITNNVHKSLSCEMECAKKLLDALESFSHPKEKLPKVSLNFR